MEKNIHEFKVEFVYLCVGEKKNNSFEITVIILRYTRNVNVLFKKDFKITERLTKHPFFFSLDTVIKMAKETDKGDVEDISQ